jgi:V8-like Glu-specific endopeptidase
LIYTKKQTKQSFSTGFLIDNNHVVTTAHDICGYVNNKDNKY